MIFSMKLKNKLNSTNNNIKKFNTNLNLINNQYAIYSSYIHKAFKIIFIII